MRHDALSKTQSAIDFGRFCIYTLFCIMNRDENELVSMKNNIAASQVNKTLLTMMLVCLMLFGQSCNGWSAFLSPTGTSSAPTEEAVSGDCLWKATGKAWSDDNQNGVWDNTEKPLANIKFWVDDPLNNLQKVNDFPQDNVPSNADGTVEISVWLPGCPEVEFVVYTEAPQNCKLTTPERISVDLNSQDPVYSFGFVCQ